MSEPFSLYNGTRQGCPLSPILFALSLEPFLAMVRNNPNIHGIKIGTSEHKCTMYADDVLFYVQHPLITLPNLMSAFTKFEKLSNFKINLAKSEILNILIPHNATALLKPFFPFSWQPHSLKYLGIYLTPNPASLFRRNYIPLLNTIRTDPDGSLVAGSN